MPQTPPPTVARISERVSLYLGVMLVIDLTGYASDLFLLLSDEPATLPEGMKLLRWSVTGVLLVGWAITRSGRGGDLAAMITETVVTLGVGWAYVTIGQSYPVGPIPELGAAMAQFGIVLLLVLRAALVPSPVWRTFVLGCVAFGGGLFIAARGSAASFDVNLWESLGFMGAAFVIATSATSKVIYGLREQVRDAMQYGQYTLEKKLGEGGMGEVYRARHALLRRPTAVKLLPASRSSARAVERFEREVQLTAALTHPNTIRIHDYGRTSDGIFYYAMEYLDGATLAEVVEVSGPQSAERVVFLLEQVAWALEEAHGAGLVHRDIKPENLMLTRRGLNPDAMKVLDFGLVEASDSSAEGHELAGTPRFIAPELITASAPASPASDLYALGAVAYHLLTATHVFPGQGLVEICSHHVHSEPEPPSGRTELSISEALERLVLSMLAKSPDERPAGAAALAEALATCPEAGKWSIARAEDWWARFGPELALRRGSERPPSGNPTTLAIERNRAFEQSLRSGSRPR